MIDFLTLHIAEILIGFSITFLGYLTKKLNFRISNFNVLSIPHSNEAREGIQKCKEVMRLISASGGLAQHPWKTEIGIIKEDELAGYFSRLSQRTTNRKLKKSIVKVNDSLRAIFAASVFHYPIVVLNENEYFDGKTPDEREVDLTKSKIQLGAFNVIESELPRIEHYIAKYERRAARIKT